MPIIETKTGKTIFKKAESLIMIPYSYNSTIEDYVLGTTVFDISSIIGDSIAVEQDDGNVENKYNEFKSEPLVKNVTMGEWKFSAQCLDMQNKVLRALFSVYYNDNAGIAAIRNDYETMYALIRIRFSEANTPDVYLPKVSMNNKLLIQQLRTRASQGTISGVLQSQRVAVIYSAHQGQTAGELYALDDIVGNRAVYSVETPVLFVPKNKTPLFFNHQESGSYYFDEIKSSISGSEDCCAHNRVVKINNPKYYRQ